MARESVYNSFNGQQTISNKLHRQDNINIFNPNYKDLRSNGIIIGPNQKTIYINMHKWIKHLEASVLVKPHRELTVIKSACHGASCLQANDAEGRKTID